jgi:glycogen debranching enzyme
MDAKVGDWVVTPRRGKPVEIQALWYNALCIMEDLASKVGDEPGQKRYRNMATVASWSFNRLFWNENTGCLYDVTNGAPPDPSIRPNQIFAVSLTHSMLSSERAKSVVGKVQEHLLTPYGLRSLAPSDPQYRGRYTGGPSERDGAYHQGTVWPWLLGPFITAYVKVNGGSDAARRQATEWLAPLKDHLADGGLGHISEILDGDAPQRPCGCMAQAWSVAEIMRALVEDVYGLRPMAPAAASTHAGQGGQPRGDCSIETDPHADRNQPVIGAIGYCAVRVQLRRYCEESTSHAAVIPVVPRSAISLDPVYQTFDSDSRHRH